ncbi:zinc metallopeptidase [Hymenobacter ginsengisoli]|uniref:Zinc metallopeptidase n=1 Tax=Hymenobacter ginsengisoli TaxID=1051626 RepID=A0ABP8QEP5_9BACT|nr:MULTISPECIES: zinc metallopeptidase [unclassified Hymenobacter]MBO2033171.1 zinc metallopeptidase [Hymenobacter sp. BT559]
MYLILILLTLVSFAIQQRLRSKFRQYAAIGLRSGLSGREVASKMLRDHGIYDVQIISTEGQLSDHYNPTDKTVNLSADVYSGYSATAAAVAAHECGHAVQHAQSYSFLQLRSALVPVLSSISRFMPLLLLAGVFMLRTTPVPLEIGIALFAFATLFSFITLPVEFDASRRALAWMDRSGVVTTDEHAVAKDALRWAALTYVVAAVSSLATLLYYVSFLGGNRRN